MAKKETSNPTVPVLPMLKTVEQMSRISGIGENKLRKLAEENSAAGWVIMNGNRIQIKRKQFEKMIDTVDAI